MVDENNEEEIDKMSSQRRYILQLNDAELHGIMAILDLATEIINQAPNVLIQGGLTIPQIASAQAMSKHVYQKLFDAFPVEKTLISYLKEKRSIEEVTKKFMTYEFCKIIGDKKI